MADDVANGGLVLPVGFTEKQAAQQLARIEAEAVKRAKGAAQAFSKANDAIVKSTTGMSRQARAQIQNVSYQLQDIFVQISGGQGVTRALSQQMPQLLGAFGAFGAVLGTVSAVAIPLVGSMFDLGDGTSALSKATTEAEKALQAYRDALDNTNLSAAELTARYGEAAGAARELLSVIAATAEAQALIAQRDALNEVSEAYSGLINEAEAYRETVASGNAMALEGWAEQMAADYGLAIDQALRLADVMSELGNASDAQSRNALLTEMAEILRTAAREGGELDAELVKSIESAAQAALSVINIDNAASGASKRVADLATGMANLAAQANSAAAAMGAAGVFVGSDGSIQRTGRQNDPSTAWRFEDPNKDYDTLAERRAREAEAKARAAELAARRAAGGGTKGGRKSAKEKKEPGLFDSVERDLENLEREIRLVGMSTAEVAKLRAQWAMLDEAKQRGIPVNDALNAQIEAQATQVGELAEQLERAEIGQQRFEEAVDGIADAFAGALVAGDSLRDGLANVFKQIAADILTSGIRQSLMSVFGGTGLFQSFMGGGDRLTGALRMAGAFAEGGYTGDGGKLEPAGVVHKGEYVMSKQAVQNIGLRNLDALHQSGLRGYSSGGFVGRPCEGGPEFIMEVA